MEINTPVCLSLRWHSLWNVLGRSRNGLKMRDFNGQKSIGFLASLRN